jgi:hypothetical protein
MLKTEPGLVPGFFCLEFLRCGIRIQEKLSIGLSSPEKKIQVAESYAISWVFLRSSSNHDSARRQKSASARSNLFLVA